MRPRWGLAFTLRQPPRDRPEDGEGEAVLDDLSRVLQLADAIERGDGYLTTAIRELAGSLSSGLGGWRGSGESRLWDVGVWDSESLDAKDAQHLESHYLSRLEELLDAICWNGHLLPQGVSAHQFAENVRRLVEGVLPLLERADTVLAEEGEDVSPSPQALPEHRQQSLADQVVQLCDEMLHLGREPGSGGPFAVTASRRHPPKRPSQKGEGTPDAEALPAVGEHKSMSGPSGLAGRMGLVSDEQWEALAAEFDRRAANLADLVTALDSGYDVGRFYSPQPVSVWEAYPTVRKALTEAERKWHRDHELARGKTEAEADALLDSLDRMQEAQTCAMWTKMQWPGCVVDVAGHRHFLSDPAVVHAFDRRFKSLRAWAAERVRQAVDERAADSGRPQPLPPGPQQERQGSMSDDPETEIHILRRIVDAIEAYHDSLLALGGIFFDEADEIAAHARAEENAIEALDLVAASLPLLRRLADRYGWRFDEETEAALASARVWKTFLTTSKRQLAETFGSNLGSVMPGGVECESPLLSEIRGWLEKLVQEAQAEPIQVSRGLAEPSAGEGQSEQRKQSGPKESVERTGQGPTALVLDPDTPVAASRIAMAHGLDPDSLRKRLERERAKGFDRFVEVENRKPREPRFLYYPRAVQPVIDAMKKKASGEASDERPSRKKTE